MPALPPPSVVALVTCATIYVDDVSRKVSLLGVCNGFQASAFPVVMPPLFVYLALTDGRGPTELSVRLVEGGKPRRGPGVEQRPAHGAVHVALAGEGGGD